MRFFDRLVNSWKIFIFSFSLLKKDKSLIAVPIIMIFSSVLLLTGLVFTWLATSNYFIVILFLFFMYFVLTFLTAMQSWMVHEVLMGKDTTVGSGFKRAFENTLDILAFATSMLAITLVAGWLRGKGKLGQIGASTITLLGGIAGKLVLPAMIVTERHFGQALKQLVPSLKAVPEIAPYEIGIRPITKILTWTGISIAILLLFSSMVKTAVLFFVIWIFAQVLLTKYINITYYTVLYLTLVEKKKVKGIDIKM